MSEEGRGEEGKRTGKSKRDEFAQVKISSTVRLIHSYFAILKDRRMVFHKRSEYDVNNVHRPLFNVRTLKSTGM